MAEDNGTHPVNYDNLAQNIDTWTEHELADLLDRFYAKREILAKFVEAHAHIERRIRELEKVLGKKANQDLFVTSSGAKRERRSTPQIEKAEVIRIRNDILKLLQDGERLAPASIAERINKPKPVVNEVLEQMSVSDPPLTARSGQRRGLRWFLTEHGLELNSTKAPSRHPDEVPV